MGLAFFPIEVDSFKNMVKRINGRKTRAGFFFLALAALAGATIGLAPLAGAATSDFASPLFSNVWLRTDLGIASQKVSRSWYWGPKPLGTGGFYEDYADSPGGKRVVQYFDKSRMELNDPTKNAVTNGLLVVEMVTGKMQKGDFTFSEVGRAPIPIAGDFDNPWPTYAGLSKVYGTRAGVKVGDQARVTFYPAGLGEQNTKLFTDTTKISTIQNGYGIPAAFWDFLNRKGQIFKDGQYSDDTISDWLFSTGYPVTEAYWSRVKVGGVSKEVLYQAFERRVLTYTPDNDPAYRVEMGNVGLHYVAWRYSNNLPQGGVTVAAPAAPVSTNPLAQAFLNSTAEWYTIDADALNVRTAPNSQALRAPNSETQPYIQQIFAGDHVQAIGKVKGEELEKGNDTWLQIYADPNLYVYSAYAHKITPGDFPTPAKTFKGIWVAVSIDKQLMAVYDTDKMIYKTMISSGRSSDDPEKDYRTPLGAYNIIGSYRPQSQTMEGGASDKAIGGDHYKIENIRNVNYFFQDYSIHGTYWHAKFGIQAMSHGCVNATVYDAGLIYTLKAGTTVFVF